MKPNRKIVIFLFFFAVILLMITNLTSQEFRKQDVSQDSLPKPFRISPQRSNDFLPLKVVYSPVLDKFVVFFIEFVDETRGIVYSRVYNSKGKKAGKLHEILNEHERNFLMADVAYNEKKDQFLLVWSDGWQDKMTGKILDGQGRNLAAGDKEDLAGKTVVIKPPTYAGSCLYPRAIWIPSAKQYAVVWTTGIFGAVPYHPSNGYYMAALKSNLKIVLKPKQVKQQSTKNQGYPISALIPLEDRMLWGCADEVGTWQGSWSRPMVFFTDFEGEILGEPIHVNKKLKGGGWIGAAYYPSSGIFLLTWNEADHRFTRYQTYQKSYYRMMRNDGKFTKPKQAISPPKQPFQSSASVLYSTVKKMSFLVWPEYKILYEGSKLLSFPGEKYKSFYGGKLWCRWINKKGKAVGSAKPLTVVISDPEVGMYLGESAYNPLDNSFFITCYILHNIEYRSSIWGLIYK